MSTIYAECRQCDECGHIGINDSHDSDAACGRCGWSGPSPTEDHCPECGEKNCMSTACPECSGRYCCLAEAHLPIPTPAIVRKALADRDAMLTGTTAVDPGDFRGRSITLDDMKAAIRKINAMPKPDWILIAPDGRCWADPDPLTIVRALMTAIPMPAWEPIDVVPPPPGQDTPIAAQGEKGDSNV